MVGSDSFYKDLSIQIDRELESEGAFEGNSKEIILTKIMTDNLSSGNTPAIRGADKAFRFDNVSLNAKINGFFIDAESEHSITAYTTFYSASPGITRLHSGDVSDSLKKLDNFFKIALTNKDQLFEIIHEDSPVYDLLFYLASDFKEVEIVNYVLLTNCAVGEIKLPSFSLKSKTAGKERKVSVSVFDIERYRRFMSGNNVVEINADRSILGRPIPCCKIVSERSSYDTYCCILSGETIYNLFDAYHYQLLNSNVRTYLQLRGSVNKGIMETIENNPDYFLAYNNGISATANKVVLDMMGRIVELKDFQIVNGGQTSASIYNAKANKGFDISKVNVMAKITVIKNENNYGEMVKSISKYANTQNAVKFSDFSSNDKYNKKLSEFSRSIYSPAIGSQLQTKWYYENVSGTYNNERSDSPSTTSFDKEYPKKQYFKKTDMASYELSYQGFPAEACKGAQDAYKVFVMNLPSLKEPTEEDFKNLIAKKILFDSVLEIINQEIGGQGKAAMARYVVAYFSAIICKFQLDLDSIWKMQNISVEMRNDLRILAKQMCSVLAHNAYDSKKSVEMYCRKPATWELIKTMVFSVDNDAIYSNGVRIEPVLKNRQISSNMAAFLLDIPATTWGVLALNCSYTSFGNEKTKDSDSKMCKTMMDIDRLKITEKQIAYAAKILYKFYNSDYSLSADIREKIFSMKDEFEEIVGKKNLKGYMTSPYYV